MLAWAHPPPPRWGPRYYRVCPHSVYHAAQSRECEERKRKLDARRDAHFAKTAKSDAQSSLPPSKKFGIIRIGNKRTSVMKKAKNAMLALTLALTGAAGLCMASDASVRKDLTPPLEAAA